MSSENTHNIYTIGHSTRSIEDFIAIMKFYKIECLVDIRRFPHSRKFTQFDQENLRKTLEENAIRYQHMEELGGRRKVSRNSENNRWRNSSFKGYADYMETPEFKKAVHELEKIASGHTTAYMCSEILWWRCHRSLVSDWLKLHNWEVTHIISLGETQPHRYTSPALIIDGRLSYSDKDVNDESQ